MTARQPAPPAAQRQRFGPLYRSLAINIGLPLVTVLGLLHLHYSAIVALSAAAIFPVVATALEAMRKRRIEFIALVSLISIIVGLAASFLTGNAVFAIVKDSLTTSIFGLFFLGSLLTPRPLIYRLSLQFAGDDPAAIAQTEGLWERPAARHIFRLLTIVWGVGLLLEATVRVIAALTLPSTTAAALSPVIALVAVAGLTVWTVLFTRAQQRRAAAASS